MAFIETRKTRSPQGSALAQALHASFDRVKEAYDARRAYLATLRELSALSDRDLADFGLARSDIDAIARS